MSPGPDQVAAMRSSDFERIRQMTYDFCGVDLDGKQVLVSARLGKKVRELGLASFDRYCEHVANDPSGSAFSEMIDALTTNHTSFFRESRHFEFLRTVILPGLAPAAPLRIWSAACSSGEEPYTIAFSLVDALGSAAMTKVSITATDISTRVLKKAQRGLYPQAALSALTPAMMKNCLLKGNGQYQGQCLVRPEIREMIDFRQLNLLEDCSSVGPFEVIFCRNVMIYFDLPTQQTAVNQLISRLAPGGYLLIGHAESLNGIEHPLRTICTATFQKSGNGAVPKDYRQRKAR